VTPAARSQTRVPRCFDDKCQGQIRPGCTEGESTRGKHQAGLWLAGITGRDAKSVADFKTLWDQFKATRDNQIIPAIYKGNAEEAKKIADGIQFERLSKMWSIMSCK
jgi:hypothetical protein